MPHCSALISCSNLNFLAILHGLVYGKGLHFALLPQTARNVSCTLETCGFGSGVVEDSGIWYVTLCW